MKYSLKNALFIVLIGALVSFPHAVEASCNLITTANYPSGNKTLTDSVCSIDSDTVEGADIAANELDTTNTASITLSNSSITLAASGATLAAGSVIITDGSSSMGITGGQYLGGNGIWIDDADADGWALTDFTLYTATASSRRRLGLMRSVSTADCNDTAGNYNLNNSCGLGDGGDGAVTISANKNINTDLIAEASYADGIAYRVTAPADSATSVARYSGSDTISNGIAAGDEVLLINLQGSSTDYADAGNYEFMQVSAVSASTITFSSAITKSFDGTSAANQKVVVQRVPNYTDVTINNGITLTASAFEGLTTTPTGSAGYYTGIVAFRANGTVTITGSITASALGYRGGTAATGSGEVGHAGEAYCGSSGGEGGASTATGSNGVCGGGGGGGTNLANGVGNAGGTGPSVGGAGGGGGVSGHQSTRFSGPGSGGGYGSAASGGNAGQYGAASNGGTNSCGAGGTSQTVTAITTSYGGAGGGGGTYGSASLTTLFYGSGGGGGAAVATPDGAAGGNGGGMVYITGSTISITGTISSGGGNGGNSASLSTTYSGGGGGGAGGSIYILGTTVTLGSALVTASAGSAGTGPGFLDPTAGGVGRIAVGATTLSGGCTALTCTEPDATAVSAP